MGHLRLCILPKTPKWRTVIGFLEDPSASSAQIADLVIDGSVEILTSKTANSTVAYCIWLLAQLTQASRTDDFKAELSKIGISVTDQTSASEFLARTSWIADQQMGRITPNTAFNNISALSLSETLSRTVGAQSNTLFGSGLRDVQIALKNYSTNKQFSNLLHIYFSTLLRRTLRFVIDHEILNHLGNGKRFQNIQQLSNFEDGLDAFASQTSRIVDTFSGGWYSKKLWQEGSISQEDAKRFVGYALKKLRSDLELSEGAQ